MIEVVPVLNYKVRGLCVHPYPNHPKGCPNFGKRDICPPIVKVFEEAYRMDRPIYAVINNFPLAEHVAAMRAKHPHWTYRQLVNLLYWQPKARKRLRGLIQGALRRLPSEYRVCTCPEGTGVDVTGTLAAVGIDLEWPPIRIACQVALLVVPMDQP